MGIPTFMHAPLTSPERDELERLRADFAVLGAPLEMAPSTGLPGASLGPRSIRLGSEALTSYNAEYDIDCADFTSLVDCGDVSPEISQVAKTHSKIQLATSEILRAGATPIILGGDHSIPIPVGRALNEVAKGKIGMIQFDSHLDTWDDPSWFKDGNWSPMLRCAELKNFEPNSFVQIGIRGDQNPPETIKMSKDLGMKTFFRREIFERGIIAIAEEAIDIAHRGTERVYLTFDIDVLDAAHAPATSAPAIGGLSTIEATSAVLEIAKSGVDCFDVVEVGNPSADPNNLTGRAAATIILRFLTGVALRRAGRI